MVSMFPDTPTRENKHTAKGALLFRIVNMKLLSSTEFILKNGAVKFLKSLKNSSVLEM